MKNRHWSVLIQCTATPHFFYVFWHCTEIQRLAHTCWEVCVFSEFPTRTHTLSFPSPRQSQSCQCQMLICHAAAGELFHDSPDSADIIILSTTCCFLCNNFLHCNICAVCQMRSPICSWIHCFEKKFRQLRFKDHDTIFDTLDLLQPLIVSVTVGCDFEEMITKIFF